MCFIIDIIYYYIDYTIDYCKNYNTESKQNYIVIDEKTTLVAICNEVGFVEMNHSLDLNLNMTIQCNGSYNQKQLSFTM